jgi:hypothetical protein
MRERFLDGITGSFACLIKITCSSGSFVGASMYSRSDLDKQSRRVAGTLDASVKTLREHALTFQGQRN